MQSHVMTDSMGKNRKIEKKKAALSGRGKDWHMPYGAVKSAPEARERVLESAAALAGDERFEETGGMERPREAHVQSDSLSAYLNEIRRFRLLRQSEERDLAVRASTGDRAARETMVRANLRLVVNIARRYLGKGLELPDLIEEGNIGLMKAVDRFSVSKGCKFSTYATFWIRQSIERGIANHGKTVRLPIHISADLSKVNRASRALTASLDREPNIEEIAEKTGLSGRYVKKLDCLKGKEQCLSLDLRLDDSGCSFMDMMPDTDSPAQSELLELSRRSSKIRAMLGELDRNERSILSMRFGFGGEEPLTLEEIGSSFGITRERVRQIEVRAIRKLREMMGASGITSLEAI